MSKKSKSTESVQLIDNNRQKNLVDYINPTTSIEKKRPRVNLNGEDLAVNPDGLIEMQLSSYAEFLQRELPMGDRKLSGLHAAFHSVFPIASASEHIALEYLGYEIGETTYDVNSCLLRGKTYSAPLQVKLRLVVYDKEQLPDNKVVKNITIHFKQF